MVVLTWNEQANIQACLEALARQHRRDFEVLVLDAGSSDRTVAIVQSMRAAFPVPLGLHADARKTPIGEARNLGVNLARSPLIAFLSADAEPEPHWVEEAIASLASADLAFGRQVHAPHRWTVGAAVRGTRYHFPAGRARNVLGLASNVAAAYRREVLEAFPFEPTTNAAEDVLLAHRAAAAGYLAVYNPRMVVRHHDVPNARVEWRKSVREGDGMGRYAAEVGRQDLLLAWGAGLMLAAALALVAPPVGLPVFAAILWMPALRRALRRRAAMPPTALVAGTVAGPLFDAAFLATYVKALAAQRLRRRGRNPGTGPGTSASPGGAGPPTAALAATSLAAPLPASARLPSPAPIQENQT